MGTDRQVAHGSVSNRGESNPNSCGVLSLVDSFVADGDSIMTGMRKVAACQAGKALFWSLDGLKQIRKVVLVVAKSAYRFCADCLSYLGLTSGLHDSTAAVKR